MEFFELQSVVRHDIRRYVSILHKPSMLLGPSSRQSWVGFIEASSPLLRLSVDTDMSWSIGSSQDGSCADCGIYLRVLCLLQRRWR